MIREQIAARGVRDQSVLAAMRAVPRELFVPESLRVQAYDDCALPVGPQQTISQPFIVAYMTQQLAPTTNSHVLEIGTGTGYQAAILAKLAGTVDTIEYDADLAEQARLRLARLGLTNVRCHVGDGSLGLAKAGPFDRILVTAGCPEVPSQLVAQLKIDGELIAPVGSDQMQTLLRVTRRTGGWREQWLLACRFVKLLGRYGWQQ